MKEKLRTVFFNINEENLTLGDLNFENPERIMDEHHGYFHRFGDIIVYDAKQEKNLLKTVAIIEEIKTGIVYEVSPHCIRFANK